MKTSDALLNWFDTQIESLSDEYLSADVLLQRLKNAPIGITNLKATYKTIPLSRSGPQGWTYFPADDDGTRLARISYSSFVPRMYVKATVKLYPKAFAPADTESYTVSDYAILTVDNFTAHGKVEKRRQDPANKRRKLCVHH